MVFLRLAGGTAWRIARAVLSQVTPRTSAPREWLRWSPLALRGAQPGGWRIAPSQVMLHTCLELAFLFFRYGWIFLQILALGSRLSAFVVALFIFSYGAWAS